MQKEKWLIKYYFLAVLGIWSVFSMGKTLLAQRNEIRFKEITTKEGVLDDVVMSIVQDKHGYMWFGTRSGLVRFDGINFQNYTYDPDLPDGLSGNNIVGLHIDKEGILWIGTINGLCRFDEKLGRPVRINIKINDKIIYPYVQGIESSKNGLIWIATLDRGLISYNPIFNKSVQYTHSKNDKNSILSNRCRIFYASNDILWIATDKGLNTFDQKKQLFEQIILKKENNKVVQINSISSIKEGTNGDIWIGTENSGIIRFNPDTREFTEYQHNNSDNSISSNFVRSILFDNNKLWIGSGRGADALNKIDLETGIVEKYNVASENQRIFGSSVNEIVSDKTGIIWIARSLNGIKYFDPLSPNYKQYLIDNSGNENIVNRIYGINPISNTRLWASTFDGVILYDLDHGVQKHVRVKGNSQSLLNGNSILVNNEVWFPSRERGIVKYSLTSEKLSYINQNSNNKNSLSSNYVNTLIKDNEGIVWSGSRDGGLDRIDPRTNIIKRYNNIPGDLESLPQNSVYALLEENENELWVGTNGGLSLFNKNNETFKTYHYDANDTSSISSEQISYILKSKNGTLWVATYGGGLNKFDYDKIIFKRYTSQKNNISNNTIYCLAEDDKGFIWVSTARGIARF